MKFRLNDRLRQYMEENHRKDILIIPRICHTWGGSVFEVSARFVDLEEAARLRKENFHSFPNEIGEVFIFRIPQKFEETVELGMSRFFRRITVEGIYST